MKKIDKSKFNELVSSINDIAGLNTLIPPIPRASVNEFRLKSKYCYDINQNIKLKECQTKLAKRFINELPLNNSAKAFRKGNSYLDFIEEHRASFHFLRLDIKNFFHSISDKRIKNTFSLYFEAAKVTDSNEQLLIDAFVNLVTFDVPKNSTNTEFSGKNILPMGFITSPGISNVVFRKQDILIQKFCSTKEIHYTRYADDMLFSAPRGKKFLHSQAFQKEIEFLIGISEFKLNNAKRIAANHTISLNGYVISANQSNDCNGSIKVSNKKTSNIEKTLHALKNKVSPVEIMKKVFGFKVSRQYFKYFPPEKEFLEKYCKDQLSNKLVGYRAYLISLIKYSEKKGGFEDYKIEKYRCLINSINKYLHLK